MNDNSTTSSISFISTVTVSTTTKTISILKNDTLYNIIKSLLNGSDLYHHQIGDLIEPEKYSVRSVHAIIWTMSIVTYLIAIPIAGRIIRSKAYLNVIDYFSFHIVLCAFIAWIPALILILYHWFQLFTLRLCRLHYIILSTNETVPLFFVLYMVIDRFLYAYPSFKQKLKLFSHMYCIHLYAIFTWLLIMLVYAFASPFDERGYNPIISLYTKNYCPYNYSKLGSIATARSIIYFCLLIPSLILISFVLRYFYLLRGTNQVEPIQKLWTIRVTSLLCVLIFYDIYLYYLEHISETFRSFLVASLLRSTFYLAQICAILSTESYWIEFMFERCSCLCCFIIGRRRKTTTPVAIPIETEIDTFPYSSSTGHYSLVDDNGMDEFEQATNGPQPTLRVMA